MTWMTSKRSKCSKHKSLLSIQSLRRPKKPFLHPCNFFWIVHVSFIFYWSLLWKRQCRPGSSDERQEGEETARRRAPRLAWIGDESVWRVHVLRTKQGFSFLKLRTAGFQCWVVPLQWVLRGPVGQSCFGHHKLVLWIYVWEKWNMAQISYLYVMLRARILQN